MINNNVELAVWSNLFWLDEGMSPEVETIEKKGRNLKDVRSIRNCRYNLVRFVTRSCVL